jgi:hypothetical protein
VIPVEARLVQLTARMDYAVWQLQQDELVSFDPLQLLLHDVLDLAAELPDTDRRAIYGRMETLQRELQAAHDRLGARIGGVGAGRRAVHGYAASGRPAPSPALLRTRA